MTNEELVKKIQEGENVRENLEALYLQNIGMINRIVARYAGIEDPEDLRQEAFLAVHRAALLWSADAGGSFITYAVYWIRQYLQRYIDNCGGVVRVPSHQMERIRKYRRIMNSYRVQFGREPEPIELMYLLNLSADQLEDLKKDVHALRIRSTAEVIGGEDEDITLEDTIPAEGDDIEDLIESIQAQELQRVLWGCVDALKQQEASVIRSRYLDKKTLKECSEAMGVSKEYIRRLEFNAMRSLRHGDNLRRLRPFLTDYGAYNAGFRNTSLSGFKRTFTSSQEYAVMNLEDAMRWGNLQGAVIQV